MRSESKTNKAAVSKEALKHKLKLRKREERANKKVKESFSSSATSIESVDDDDDDDDDSTEADLITSNEQSSKKRQYVTRPDNWAIIGEHFAQHKFESTLKVFKQHLDDEGYDVNNETTMVKCFQRWKKGWSKKKSKHVSDQSKEYITCC